MVFVGGDRSTKKQRRHGNCCGPESHRDVCSEWRGFEVLRADVTLQAKKGVQRGRFRMKEAFDALARRNGGRKSDEAWNLY